MDAFRRVGFITTMLTLVLLLELNFQFNIEK